jgi:hypothetical protein
MNRPRSVSIALGFLALNALIWFGYGSALLLGFNPGLSISPPLRILIGLLAIGFAAVLLALVYWLTKRNRLAYVLSLGLLLLLSLLALADQVGLWDWLSLVGSLAPALLLIKDRGWYLG